MDVPIPQRFQVLRDEVRVWFQSWRFASFWREKEGGSCTILAARVVVRNVIAADEVVDTVESSGHYAEIGYFLF